MTSVFDVIDLMTDYQQAAALTAAARLGVFDTLAAEPLNAPQLAERLGTDQRATLALADALVAMGLLTASSEGYRATATSARLGHQGDLRLVAEKEAFFARHWLDLEESIRTGEPRLDPWRQRLVDDPEQVLFFLRALVVLARETGPDLTGIPGLGTGCRVADFGGGLGAYATALATAGAAVTLIDLPPVVEWARKEIKEHHRDLLDAITFVPADLLEASSAATIGSQFDAVLLSHLLHDLNDDDSRAVLRRAVTVTRPAGTVVVFELPGDPPGSFGPLFDLMMRVETPGRARRIDELTELMIDAGLTDVHVSPDHQLPHGVLIGTVA